MNCKNCGNQLLGNETTCPVCGAIIIPENNAVNTQAVPVPETPVVPVAPTPVVPEAPVAPAMPEVAPAVPEVPAMPAMPEVPTAPAVPAAPVMPAMPEVASAPVVPEAPAMPAMPEAPVAPVAPAMPEMNAGPVTPEVGPMVIPSANLNTISNVQEQTTNQKSHVNKKLVAFLLIGVVLIGLCLVWTYVIQADPEEPETPVTPTEPETEQITQNGYTFELPFGYTLITTNEYGAVISNNSITYTIEIDYNNKIDAYKTKLEEAYADKKDTMKTTIEDNEYYIVDVKDSTDAIASMYATKTNDGDVITGFVAKSDFTKVEETDYTTLDAIISGGTFDEEYDVESSTFGKDGVKLLTFDKTKLSK